MQIINGARKYLYISTPYLIVDDLMLSALTLAARSGVDVRIPVSYTHLDVYKRQAQRKAEKPKGEKDGQP